MIGGILIRCIEKSPNHQILILAKIPTHTVYCQGTDKLLAYNSQI